MSRFSTHEWKPQLDINLSMRQKVIEGELSLEKLAAACPDKSEEARFRPPDAVFETLLI